MIIELSKAFADFQAADWEPYHSALENLIQAHGNGWHLLSPSRGVLASIEGNCQLSRTQSLVIKHYIGERIATTMGQAKSADFTLLCVEDGAELRSERNNQIPIRLRVFNDLAMCAPARLITENARVDGELLKLIAETAGRELGYGMRLNLEQVHGGGGTTGACYEEACKSPRPTICIVDSDQHHPESAKGSTARKVLEYERSHNHNTVKSFVLPVRELENAVPISFLFDVYANDPQVRQRVSILSQYIEFCKQQSHHPCASLSFMDLKNGLRHCDVAAVPVNQKSTFSRFATRALGRQVEFDDIHDITPVFQGISENMLEKLLEFINSNHRNIVKFFHKLKKSPNWDWIEGILRHINSFGAASERMPIHSR